MRDFKHKSPEIPNRLAYYFQYWNSNLTPDFLSFSSMESSEKVGVSFSGAHPLFSCKMRKLKTTRPHSVNNVIFLNDGDLKCQTTSAVLPAKTRTAKETTRLTIRFNFPRNWTTIIPANTADGSMHWIAASSSTEAPEFYPC